MVYVNDSWLIRGDCLEKMGEIPDNSVDMVLTDPPYGTTACKWDSVIPFEPMWEHLERVTKQNCAILFMASEPFASFLRISKIKSYRYDWVWHKNKSGNTFQYKNSPMKRHEQVLVFHRGGIAAGQKTKYNPILTDTKKRVFTIATNPRNMQGVNKTKPYIMKKTGYPESVLFFPVDKKRLHPTQKPLSLMEYFIGIYTNNGDTVLDFTMGSGTTGVAAKNLKRKFVGIELDKEYFEIAKKRIEDA